MALFEKHTRFYDSNSAIVSEHLDQDGNIGGGSHRLGVTSHQERVRPVKERVGSSARNGDGEGGTNDVYASRILGSRLGRPDGFDSRF